jgi:hypothetical protein
MDGSSCEWTNCTTRAHTHLLTNLRRDLLHYTLARAHTHLHSGLHAHMRALTGMRAHASCAGPSLTSSLSSLASPWSRAPAAAWCAETGSGHQRCSWKLGRVSSVEHGVLWAGKRALYGSGHTAMRVAHKAIIMFPYVPYVLLDSFLHMYLVLCC